MDSRLIHSGMTCGVDTILILVKPGYKHDLGATVIPAEAGIQFFKDGSPGEGKFSDTLRVPRGASLVSDFA